MKWTGLNEIREMYLKFFEGKDHLRLPSFPLVPQGDKSILLINAGMTPMKKYFTGEETPPRKRVTTCQKCIRTPDIERVGITARHGTYFEMLGNFSFGDYFKKEIIPWAWEFCTETIGMDPENPDDLGAEVQMCIGEDMEKHIFTKSCTVIIPGGTPHGNFRIIESKKPWMFVQVQEAAERTEKFLWDYLTPEQIEAIPNKDFWKDTGYDD